MDLDAAADELYGVSPDDFIARRTELVAQARAAGDRPLAKQIGQLRRPTRTGWLVNVVARQAPEDLSSLLELGPALADAQQRGAGDDLRRLSQERRRAVDALARRSLELGREHGYQAPDAALQEVAQTLQAALGDPTVADVVRRGRLTQATTYGGFGPGDLSAALAASMPGQSAAGSSPASAPASSSGSSTDHDAEAGAETEVESEEDRQRRAEAEQAAAQAKAAWTQARDDLREAEDEAERATEHADDLADQVESLRSQLRAAEAEEREAREHARSTRKRATELRRACASAEHAATAAAEAVPA